MPALPASTDMNSLIPTLSPYSLNMRTDLIKNRQITPPWALFSEQTFRLVLLVLQHTFVISLTRKVKTKMRFPELSMRHACMYMRAHTHTEETIKS